ncbi:MAG: hypothetical protein ACI9WU_002082 [Myxococcota bacterium]|jgi:hypothetical protein
MSDPMKLVQHYAAAAEASTELDHELLQHLVAAGTARGWFPTISALRTRFAEHESEEAVDASLERLHAHQLLTSSNGRVRIVVGGITHQKGPIRAQTEADNQTFYLSSALDVLTIAPTLQKAVVVTSECPVTQTMLELQLDAQGQVTSATPGPVAAFVPDWPGGSIYEALGQQGRLLANDEALATWTAQHGDPDGLSLTTDTVASLGSELAHLLSALYVRVSVR